MLSQPSRPRDPRMEVSDALPLIPDDRWAKADGLLFSVDADAAEAFRVAVDNLSRLEQQAREGRGSASAALAMLGRDVADAAEIFAELWGAGKNRQEVEKSPPSSAARLYDLAVTNVAEERIDEAVVLLAVLAGSGAGELEALLGLAVIASRQKRMDVAFDLVSGYLEAADRHPRACSIAGICELARGDKAAAQTYLAAASRIARTRPEFRGELQIAQRALLLMHLG
jgi:hypothetical protein